MPRLKTQAAKESLLRRVRRQRLNYITILPSLVTILNGLCGFAAIVFAGKGPHMFAKAGYMLLLAMIAGIAALFQQDLIQTLEELRRFLAP